MTDSQPARGCINISEMRAIAEAATPGPWLPDCDNPDCPLPLVIAMAAEPKVVADLDGCENEEGNARFFATFNPAVVLGLLAVVEAAKDADRKFSLMEADGDLLTTEIAALQPLREALVAALQVKP